MHSKLIHEVGGLRTFVVVMDAGDEAMKCLLDFAMARNISAAQISAVGAFQSAELSFFDWERKDYLPIPVNEQVEVASLAGNVAIGPDGKPVIHAHTVLGRKDGSARAGHLKQGHVRPTLEVIVTEVPAHLRKSKDAASGLALISLDKSQP